MIDPIKHILARDLDRLSHEVVAFERDEALWQAREGIANSAGNLTLHLCGNLRHFIGHVLGKTSYTRDRDHEFNATGLTRADLMAEIEATKADVVRTLDTLEDGQLQVEYPLQVFGEPMSVEFFLLHLSGHLNYHLGQINYFRRLN